MHKSRTCVFTAPILHVRGRCDRVSLLCGVSLWVHQSMVDGGASVPGILNAGYAEPHPQPGVVTVAETRAAGVRWWACWLYLPTSIDALTCSVPIVTQSYEFDELFITNCVATQLPGAYRPRPSAIPTPVLALDAVLHRVCNAAGADCTPMRSADDGDDASVLARRPRSRDDHVFSSAAMLRLAAGRARHRVVFTRSGTSGGFGGIHSTPSVVQRKRKASPFLAGLAACHPSEAMAVIGGGRSVPAVATAPVPVEAHDGSECEAEAAQADTSRLCVPSCAVCGIGYCATLSSRCECGVVCRYDDDGRLLMSFSRLFEYQWCPRRFYLSRVARVSGTTPAEPTMALGKGASVSRCLLGPSMYSCTHPPPTSPSPALHEAVAVLGESVRDNPDASDADVTEV